MTTTDLLRKKKPSQVAQAETPKPLNSSSLGRPSHFALAPVAKMIASATIVRPLSQRTTKGRLLSSSADDIFVLDARADMLGLRAHLIHEPRPLNRFGEAGVVFDVGGDHQLAARLVAREQERLHHGARGIDRRRIAGRPGTDDHEALAPGMRRSQFDPL